jgi:hypothetical protein
LFGYKSREQITPGIYRKLSPGDGVKKTGIRGLMDKTDNFIEQGGAAEGLVKMAFYIQGVTQRND